MQKVTKKLKVSLTKYDKNNIYSLTDAANILKQISFTKFDASVDVDIRLGVDPRKANQMVRGIVTFATRNW